MRSKADVSRISPAHGNRRLKKRKREKLKTEKRMCSEVSVNSPGNPWSQSGRRIKGRLRWGGAEKEGLSMKVRSEEVMGDE